MSRRGLEKGDAIMTAEEAKNRWASYATDIDQALAEIDAAQGRDSD
jgi:hypothetical protein